MPVSVCQAIPQLFQILADQLVRRGENAAAIATPAAAIMLEA
jgi:hypothetical protein